MSGSLNKAQVFLQGDIRSLLGSYAGWGLTCACEELVSVNNLSEGGTEHAGPTSTTIASKISGPGDAFVPQFWENRKKRSDSGVPGFTKK